MKRRNVAGGNGEPAGVRDGGDVAIRGWEALAGDSGFYGQLAVLAGSVGIEGEHPVCEQHEQTAQRLGEGILAPAG